MAVAEELLDAGVPVVVCRPHLCDDSCSPDCSRELNQPKGWNRVSTEKARQGLSSFRPGVDALALVSGHGVDVLDVDTKAGGSTEHLPPVEFFGEVRTPSGGVHRYVRSTGFGKVGGWHTTAGFVGDYAGGTEDGGGRMLLYLPGSSRPRYPGATYEWTQPLDLERLIEAEPDDSLVDALMACGASRLARPGRPAASNAEAAAFLTDRDSDTRCPYGTAAIAGLVMEGQKAKPGDPVAGRHAWFMRSAARLVELMKAGCCTAADWATLVDLLAQLKPDGGTDPMGVLGWCLVNVDASTRCETHGFPSPAPRNLDDVHAAFRRWMGERFDSQLLNAVLAVAAAGLHLDGDPAWLQIVGGPGAGKTEVLTALERAGCLVVSTVSGEAALLSGTPAKQRAKDATGGLLRRMGERGVLVVKDFTSILAMNREKRAEVIAAFREVHDGQWSRDLGTDGGKTLVWQGRCTVLSGVTGAYDDHYSVIAAMGDRFLLLRLDSEDPEVRRHARRQALRNAGAEEVMRAELGDVVGGFLLNQSAHGADVDLSDAVVDEVGDLANLVALTRSEVGRDFKGEPEYAHAPEMPTRLAKQLLVILRGARMIGLGEDEALTLVRRLAHDTMPPARRKVLLAVHDNPGETSKDLSERTGMARTTADRVLRELALHGLVRHEETEYPDAAGRPRTRWTWYADGGDVDLSVLRPGYGRIDCAPKSIPEVFTPSPEAAHTRAGAAQGPAARQQNRRGDISGTDPDTTDPPTAPCAVEGCDPNRPANPRPHFASARTFPVCDQHAQAIKTLAVRGDALIEHTDPHTR